MAQNQSALPTTPLRMQQQAVTLTVTGRLATRMEDWRVTFSLTTSEDVDLKVLNLMDGKVASINISLPCADAQSSDVES